MPIEYNGLGKRVRKFRTKKNVTQEELAKECGLGTNHISNVETGNEKISLPSLVILANALEVGTDDLLCDSLDYCTTPYQNDIQELFNDCTVKEYKFLVELIDTAKSSYRKNLSNEDK